MAFAGGGLSGLASGLSAAYPGYVEGEKAQLVLDKEKQGALAKSALGNALQLLSQQPPQQPMMPQGGPPPGMPPGGGGPPPMGGPQPPPPGQPSMPMRPPMQGGGGGGPPGGMPQGGPPPGPQGGPPPQMGGGMPQMPQQGPGGRQMMDWRHLVQAVQQANPGIKPEVLMEAVNQFLPMMSMQSQQEWRQVSLQLREQALQQREQQFMLAEQGRNQRSETSAASRENVAQIGAESRKDVAGKRLEQQERQFQQRETRLGESLKLREDSTYQRLQLQKDQAKQRVDATQAKQGLAEWRAAADAQYRYVRTKIAAQSAGGQPLPKAEQKKLLDQAEMEHNEEIARLREQFGRSTPTGGTTSDPNASKVPDKLPPAGGGAPPTASQGPVKVTTPEEAQKLPPGTHYVTPDGKEFTR